MRLHVVSLPHTQTTHAYDWCAYTAKVRKFATMMHRAGHEVYLYAGEENEAECTELVPVVKRADLERWFPDTPADANAFTLVTGRDPWDPRTPWFETMNVRAAAAINERRGARDFLCCIMGRSQEPISWVIPELVPVEFGIGYTGTFAPYRAFESYAHMHYVHGYYHEDRAHNFDTVVPNYFDPEEYTAELERGDHLLYLGRLDECKGVRIAVEAARFTGATLHVAGQGNTGLLDPENVYHGVVTGDAKRELLGQAAAVMVPSLYLEPFGGVAVEAMMSGTPVVTPDWGAFTETVRHGVTGVRCRTMRDYVNAIEAIRSSSIDHEAIRAEAVRFYSTEACTELYLEWFERILTMYDGGAGYYAGVEQLLEQGARDA